MLKQLVDIVKDITIMQWINGVLTVISALCTIATIVGTIASFRYKRGIQNTIKSWKVCEYCNLFAVHGQNFINNTREHYWYKGGDPNIIINPLSNLLLRFGEVAPSLSCADELVDRVEEMRILINKYANVMELTEEVKSKTTALIYKISDELYRNRDELMKTQ